MAIIAVLRKCLSQHGNSFPTNVKMSKKQNKTGLVWSGGIFACRSNTTDKRFAFIEDVFSKDFLSFYISGLSLHPAGRGHHH